MTRRTPLETRLMRYTRFDLDTGCWVWTGVLTEKGYGLLREQGKTKRAHRLSYELWRGPIPEGLQLDHVCRNHACINPAHVQPKTNQQNSEHRSVGISNTSGYRGVSPEVGRWVAKVKIHGRSHFLGRYDTAEEAGEVAAEFRREHMTNSLLDRGEI